MGYADVPADMYQRTRRGAQGLARDDQGRVLFVRTLYGKGWIMPGGAVHDDEWIPDAMAREWAEETGLHREFGALLAVDQVPADPDSGSNPGIDFVFDAGVFTDGQAAALRVPVGAVTEIGGYEWVHPDKFDGHECIAEYTARRVRQALAAHRAGLWVPFLRHGVPDPAV
ncbi:MULTISPECIES: NUDIX hydrolase [Kitasatospora]|uniref:Nudix hydrolase domain-containing protein n=1 Tax=Kitasatospora setae (strain ATCC 33774 / DSM 43861 / JCM 3304 / KCC A-0304 / NBRC 14216 / KM-6054) TaxID=452652 RepID=E4N8A3_KITSK|nr:MULTISPECIES: NUDIX hydrolase [Kitasatospora]BAJ27434.1 hypothetical protein KSE_16080 [Kitasatospora setae KM-6054]